MDSFAEGLTVDMRVDVLIVVSEMAVDLLIEELKEETLDN